MEMVVSIGLFVAVILAATQIFSMVLEGQRSAISSQNIQGSVRYLLEIMSREVRTAQISEHECESLFASPPTADYKVYNETQLNGEEALYFKNQEGECVAYYVSPNNTLMIQRETDIASTTPDDLRVNNLEVDIEGVEIGTFHDIQPRATLLMEVSSRKSRGAGQKEMKIQTTISSRNYRD